jgi:hypothetical protein
MSSKTTPASFERRSVVPLSLTLLVFNAFEGDVLRPRDAPVAPAEGKTALPARPRPSSHVEVFSRKAVTISPAVPANAPTIDPTKASTTETPVQSGAHPKKANPSPAPSAAVTRDTPMILAITAMAVPLR